MKPVDNSAEIPPPKIFVIVTILAIIPPTINKVPKIPKVKIGL